ncbi:hypothetical protein SARC_06391 [Sphaeroforma arctica JP610]|uniref:3'-5' exonuclease domain-containing protein n=1 Tax=Sphaeroforma arctica JP610 TaxID=667725 RepID=A0A0L0FWR0_9EUKA|nr:hypothetical protein SARC_06391 [Sphaeroforma arctica JP610]KNC81280.1 hypothetical protein SARC_06391 [Sphaeroforma arctica JP610]|eukprot:XP_014155182.1 hypothetical protein SARC_06391 [Sphaeroforma arctica JP610]
MTESGSKCRNLHTDNVAVVDTGKRLKRANTVLKLAYKDLISNGFSHSNELDMSIVAISCKGGPDTLAMLQLATNSRCWLFDCVKLGATYATFLDTQLGYEIDHHSQIQVSLAKLLEKYELKHTTKDAVHSAREGDPKYWLKRPLASRAIQYAEADVSLLLKMGQQMVAHLSGALSSVNNETKLSVVLRALSLRVLYVAESKDNAQLRSTHHPVADLAAKNYCML